MVFMYYVERPEGATKPQTKRQVLERLAEAGFEHAFPDGLMVSQAGVLKGPGEKPGTILCAWPFYMKATEVPVVTINKDAQGWVDVGDGIWLGFEKEAMPTPAELQSQDLVPGHKVTMNDGNQWHIPCARRVNGTTYLPQVMQMSPDGQVTYKVKAEYRQLVKDAETVWDGLIEQWDAAPQGSDERVTLNMTLDDAMLYRIGINALRVNYRVGLHEINLLELFDTNRSLIELSLALIDWPSVIEWSLAQLKKKGQE